MTEAQWLASTNPQEMLRFLEGKVSERRLRLFACGCAEYAGYSDWRAWSDKTDISPGEFLSQEGAAYWVGLKVGQHHALRLTREEKVLRAALLRDIAGNPFRPVACADGEDSVTYPPHPDDCRCLLRRWLTNDVLGIAEAIYEERAFDRLPILADALQEAGCDNEDILRHCRGIVFEYKDGARWYWYTDTSGPQLTPDRARDAHMHVRGCHVIDLLLGKS